MSKSRVCESIVDFRSPGPALFTLALLLALAAGGCGPKQAPVLPEGAGASAAAAEEPAELAGGEEGGAPAAEAVPPTPEAISLRYEEAKRLMQLGQEQIGQKGKEDEARENLRKSAEINRELLGFESPLQNQILLDYVSCTDYFARYYREMRGDIPGAIASYKAIVSAVGTNLNAQKQFYLTMIGELYLYDLHDPAAARPFFEETLSYCAGIDPGNFSSCTEWELLLTRYALDCILRDLEGPAWKGFTARTLALPCRDFENYYLLAAGLLDSAEMDPEIWTKETGYTDGFYEKQSNAKTALDVLLINAFQGETLGAKDPEVGDPLFEKNFQRLLERFPEHPATMMLLVKYSVHCRKMQRTEEAESYRRQAEALAGKLNMTLAVDENAPPVQEFLQREYPPAPGEEAATPAESPGAAGGGEPPPAGQADSSFPS